MLRRFAAVSNAELLGLLLKRIVAATFEFAGGVNSAVLLNRMHEIEREMTRDQVRKVGAKVRQHVESEPSQHGAEDHGMRYSTVGELLHELTSNSSDLPAEVCAIDA